MATRFPKKRHQSHHARRLAYRWIWTRRELLALPPLFRHRAWRNTVRWAVGIGIVGVIALVLTGSGVGAAASFAFLYAVFTGMALEAGFAHEHRWASLRAVLARLLVPPNAGAERNRFVQEAALLTTANAVALRVTASKRRVLLDAVVRARLHGFVHISLSTRLATAAAGARTSTNLRAAVCAGS